MWPSLGAGPADSQPGQGDLKQQPKELKSTHKPSEPGSRVSPDFSLLRPRAESPAPLHLDARDLGAGESVGMCYPL